MAGHRRSVDFSYTVFATFASLAALTGTFAAETGTPDPDSIVQSLKLKLESAKAKAEQRKGSEARNLLQAYIQDVNNQSEKVFTAEQAAVLV